MSQTDRYISASNVTSAWTRAVAFLVDEPSSEVFNLAVRIENPTAEIPSHRALLEEYLGKHSGKWEGDHIQMVAQTIFPSGLLFTCPNPPDPNQRQAFYNRYMRNREIIRAHNPRGTYFQRMIWWPSWDTAEKDRINQLENVIGKIATGKVSRVVHELAVENPVAEGDYCATLYNPDRDRACARYMSFPCLSYISIKPESVEKKGGRIHMTALYRNHYFLSRAYGNYLGLGWLLKFISSATGREPGELLCVSSLAQLESAPEGLPKRRIREMLDMLKSVED